MIVFDREKVIRLLPEIAEYFRECRSNASFASKAENHFWELQNAASDAAELLKEQEAVKPIYNEEKYGDHLPHCGNCEKVLPNNAVYGKVNFCHYCGRQVKWDG